MKMIFCSIVMNLILICVSSAITKVKLLEPQPIEECSKLVISFSLLLLIVSILALYAFQLDFEEYAVLIVANIFVGTITLMIACIPTY